MLKIGSHMDMTSPSYLEGAVKQSIANNANALMVYTGAPQNTFRKDVAQFRIEEAHALMREHGIETSSLIIHAPYIINLANTVKPETFEIGVKMLASELVRCHAMRAEVMVLHPGSHVGSGEEAGVARIVEGLNLAMEANPGVSVALETMSGKGSEIGFNFAHLAAIIEKVRYPHDLSICLDTCHLHDAGYDMTDFDAVMREYQIYLPLDKIKVVHVNDSKNIRAAHKDRHANLGYGEIGFETLLSVLYHPLLENVVKILETPYINNEIAPYAQEIAMIRSKTFSDWIK